MVTKCTRVFLSRNVKNKKNTTPKIKQSIHTPGCPIKEGIREIFCLKTEKWLDNRGFQGVYCISIT